MGAVIDANGDVLTFANGDVASEDCAPECCGGGPPSPGVGCCSANDIPCGYVPTNTTPPFQYETTHTFEWWFRVTAPFPPPGHLGVIERSGVESNTIQHTTGQCNRFLADAESWSDGLNPPITQLHSFSGNTNARLTQSNMAKPLNPQGPGLEYDMTADIPDAMVWTLSGGFIGGRADGQNHSLMSFIVVVNVDAKSGQRWIGYGASPLNAREGSVAVTVLRNGPCPIGVEVAGTVRFYDPLNPQIDRTVEILLRSTLSPIAPCVQGATGGCVGCGGGPMPRTPEEMEAFLRG